MTGINASRFLFIRTHPVYAAHENISENCGIDGAKQNIQIQLEAGLLSSPAMLTEITGTCSMPALASARRIKPT